MLLQVSVPGVPGTALQVVLSWSLAQTQVPLRRQAPTPEVHATPTPALVALVTGLDQVSEQ